AAAPSNRLRGVADRIETEGDAAGEAVLRLRGERMELRAMRVAQEALEPGLAVEAAVASTASATIVLRTSMAFAVSRLASTSRSLALRTMSSAASCAVAR